MRQFDVFENPDPELRRFAPYLVALQSHHLNVLNSQVAAPMIRDAARPLTPLDVIVEFAGEQLLIAISELAAIDSRLLQRAVGEVTTSEDAIRRALDRLFTGF